MNASVDAGTDLQTPALTAKLNDLLAMYETPALVHDPAFW